MTSHSVLLLNNEQIDSLLSMKDCIETMDTMFQILQGNQKETLHFPLRSIYKLPLSEGNIGFGASMPAFYSSQETNEQFLCYKLLSVFPQNKSVGKESHHGTVSLFNGNSGELLAIFDAIQITALRTAAVSAVAVKYLLPLLQINLKEPLEIAMLGNGTQAIYHVEALVSLCQTLQYSIKMIRLWGRSEEKVKECIQQIESRLQKRNLPIPLMSVSSSVLQATKTAHIICTLLPVTEPILKKEHLRDSVLIVAVGAFSRNHIEISPEITIETMKSEDCLFVGDAKESVLNEDGDVLIPLQKQLLKESELRITELSAFSNNQSHLQNKKRIIVFKSLGLAVEDLMTAKFLFKKAKEQSTTTSFPFHLTHE